ncbi:AAA family ATPase [Shewanella phaeophyticola]|uniref:AAA family ATPase n=1 Tax=Shewanella phaeophyticola TaxID=2978345 RepID=A0ABT2NY01_9GAMM|nr:AAA family ATPase [Shewanella sp. KJ10-1]MCT8985278.1 AAA family ATPase [Shewanella sp. KJ10-1]
MIKPKLNVKRANHCYYLSTQVAETLLTTAMRYGFAYVPSQVVAALVGIKLQHGINYDIESTLEEFPIKDIHPTTTQIVHHNAEFICDLFKLDLKMKSVITLIILMNANLGLNELLSLLSDHDSDILIHTLEQDTGLDRYAIEQQLQPLVENNLIEDGLLHLPYRLTLPTPYKRILVTQKLTSREAFIEPIIKRSPAAKFTLKQFEHVNADLVCRYLKAAAKQSLTGVNILLYDPAGTGKTELSRTLAKSLKRSLLEVQSVQFEDGNITNEFLSKQPTSQRISYLNLMQSLLNGTDGSLLLVDECESVFKHADEHYSKEGLMRLLETNPVPTIWITNHISMLEPSYIRRFKLVMDIPVPDESFAYSMSKAMLKQLKVSDAFRLELAYKTKAAPAFIANAAHVANALALTGEHAETVVLEVVDAMLEACGEEQALPQYEGQLNFDPSCLNLTTTNGQDAETIISDIDDAIENGLPLRVLLSGPAGTGKTGWVHHLAENHGMDIMHIKCSDVLSKYVGESEQNIAALFKEAHRENKLMLFDEVDSLLSKRESAQAQYEVQLINELLSQLECYSVPVFAATNALASIDSAVMRRFDFKLVCDYLTEAQRHTMYRQVLGITKLTHSEKDQLHTLNQLTPGDFAILARRMVFQPNHNHRTTAITLLAEENNRKQAKGHIGFIR